MKQIETLVFDYGGVIVNIDDASVVKAMESLGVTAFKRLIHVRKIKRLMHQYINGLVAESETSVSRAYWKRPIIWRSIRNGKKLTSKMTTI